MRLLHYSNYKSMKLNKIAKQHDNLEYKPNGLWYSPEGVTAENYTPYGDYKYEIKVEYTTFDKPDPKKVLKITTCKEFDNFTFKYGDGEYFKDNLTMDWLGNKGTAGENEINTKHRHIKINWNNVSKDFAGFELIPLLKNRDLKFSELAQSVQDKYIKRFGEYTDYIWIRILDIPSGCVWNFNKATLKKFKLINK